MYRLGLLFLGVAACTPTHEQIGLADLHRTSIQVEPPNALSPGTMSLYFATDVTAHPGDDPTDCPSASDSLTVLVDNTPLAIDDTGGWDAPIDGTSECHQIRFSGSFIPNPTLGVISILDDSSTWTITGHSFATFDHLVVQPSPRGTLVVESALGQALSYAELRVTQGTVEVDGATDPLVAAYSQLIDVTGDSGTMKLPQTLSGDVSIAVTGHTTSPVTCNGPVACKVEDPIDGTIAATIN
jgi:hypothetical protein